MKMKERKERSQCYCRFILLLILEGGGIEHILHQMVHLHIHYLIPGTEGTVTLFPVFDIPNSKVVAIEEAKDILMK